MLFEISPKTRLDEVALGECLAVYRKHADMETNLKGLNFIDIDMFCIVFQFRSQKCNSSRARPSESSDDRLDLSLRFMLTGNFQA